MVSQLGRWRLGSLVRRDDAGEVRTCTDGGIGNRSERLLRFHADRSRDISAAQERGARHAALLQRFSGGGTPRLVDCRLDTDLPYLVVQQPRGISLHQWLQQSAAMEPSTLLTRVRVARQVAEVLQSAHRLGYVHGPKHPVQQRQRRFPQLRGQPRGLRYLSGNLERKGGS